MNINYLHCLNSRRIAIQETIVKRGVTTKFSDVAGLGEAKQTLKEAIILPVQFPQLFTGIPILR